MAGLNAEYVLPLKWSVDADVDGLSRYLAFLSRRIDVTVVDGSRQELVAGHALRWSGMIRHVQPGEWPGRNGKVRGVMTGVQLSRHERIVIADDDIRYSPRQLQAVVTALDDAELVRPQNYFTAWPWHARWDTARTLINRATVGDYPGTLAVRRSALLDAGGYDGDVLFENLELIRTIEAAGGRVLRADWLLVGRVPPTWRHFLGQRVRQAYDDFAQPARLIAELALLPAGLWVARRPGRLVAALTMAVALAEFGRRRAAGSSVFPASSALWAPAWLAERAVCVWLAVVARATGGVRYGDGKLKRAATPARMLVRTARVEQNRRAA